MASKSDKLPTSVQCTYFLAVVSAECIFNIITSLIQCHWRCSLLMANPQWKLTPQKYHRTYRVVQNFWGTKLSRLGQHVNICKKLLHLYRNDVHKCQNTLKFVGKHLRLKQTLQKPWKFWPSNVLYTRWYKALLTLVLHKIFTSQKRLFNNSANSKCFCLQFQAIYIPKYINHNNTMQDQVANAVSCGINAAYLWSAQIDITV